MEVEGAESPTVAAVPAAVALSLALPLAPSPSDIIKASLCVVRSGDDGSGVDANRASDGDGSTVAEPVFAFAKMALTRALLLRPLL